VIIGGDIVAGNRCTPGWLRVQGQRIAAIGYGDAPAPADVEHAGPVAAGLVDLQVNGAVGEETVGGPAALDAIDAHQLAHGVTSYLPTVITAEPPVAARAVAEIAERTTDTGSPVAGIHLEGPFLSPRHRGVHRRELLAVPRDGVPDYYDDAAVRLVTLAPELDGALDLIESLVARGVTVAIGHSAADAVTAQAAVERGASLVTHLFNAMPAFHHRDPGLAGWALGCDEVRVGIIADGIHVAPAALELVRRSAQGRVVLVSDASVAAGAGPGRHRQAGIDVRLGAEGRVTSGGGVLAGSAIALDEAARRWVMLTAADLPAALDAASAQPARAVGLDHGLRVGAPADLVLLDVTGRVLRTMRRGRWVAG
jgi:N-acetylglucosamine-6-phosphate deacetylase